MIQDLTRDYEGDGVGGTEETEQQLSMRTGEFEDGRCQSTGQRTKEADNVIRRSHSGAEVPAVPQLAEQRRRTPQEGSDAADECGAML